MTFQRTRSTPPPPLTTPKLARYQLSHLPSTSPHTQCSIQILLLAVSTSGSSSGVWGSRDRTIYRNLCKRRGLAWLPWSCHEAIRSGEAHRPAPWHGPYGVVRENPLVACESDRPLPGQGKEARLLMYLTRIMFGFCVETYMQTVAWAGRQTVGQARAQDREGTAVLGDLNRRLSRQTQVAKNT